MKRLATRVPSVFTSVVSSSVVFPGLPSHRSQKTSNYCFFIMMVNGMFSVSLAPVSRSLSQKSGQSKATLELAASGSTRQEHRPRSHNWCTTVGRIRHARSAAGFHLSSIPLSRAQAPGSAISASAGSTNCNPQNLAPNPSQEFPRLCQGWPQKFDNSRSVRRETPLVNRPTRYHLCPS